MCLRERHFNDAGDETKIALHEVDDGDETEFSPPYAAVFSRKA